MHPYQTIAAFPFHKMQARIHATGHDGTMSLPQPLRLTVRLTPRGGRDAIEGWAQDDNGRSYLKVRVAAPPVKGAANAALEKLIAKTLKCPGRAVRIVSGEHARFKHLEIESINQTDLHRIIGAPR
jgi:uncharacterized protein (TIGR00251 family)